jgi:hypothetical protein
VFFFVGELHFAINSLKIIEMRKTVLMLIIAICTFSVAAQNYKLDTIQFNGKANAFINIVILGDGYKESELNTFAEDARNMSGALFKEKPFSNYQNYFNVFIIKVPSNASGAALDPGNPIDNYFGSTFNYAGIERLLVATRNDRITNVLAHNFPEYDQVFMIVNSSKYGGSGGWVATASTHSSSAEIAIHELGHSFTNLVDEYWAGSQYAREAWNMTRETNLETLKWKNWHGEFGIGLYPFSESPTWHRPHQNCKMRFLGVPFCSVCTEATVERIHTLVSPLKSHSPVDTEIATPEFPVTFKLDLIRPNPNTLQRTWQLNGIAFSRDVDSVIINRSNLAEGDNILSVTILDTTQLSRNESHSSIHLYMVTWSINNTTTGIESITSTSNDFIYKLYPNPAAEHLNIKIQGAVHEDLKAEILDLQGRLISSHILSPEDINSLSLNGLTSGTYLINFYIGDRYVASGKFIKIS